MAEDNDTVPVTGRDCEATEGKMYAPEKAWVDEFQKQTTATLVDRVRKYARRRAGYVAATGRKVDGYFVRELVQDVLVDTWSGVLRWDPKRCTLEKHLTEAIKSRTNKQIQRGINSPHIYIGDDSDASRVAEQDASSTIADPEYPIQRIFARETMARLRAAAAGDKDVQRILDAFEAGAQTRDDVLALAKMKERTYHKAHIRLSRIVRNLTDSPLPPKARA